MHHKKLLAALDGLLCVYKPSELSMAALKRLLLRKICSTGEQTIVQRELPVIQVPIVEQHPLSGSLVVVGERVQTDYAHHPLVVGEELLANDLRLEEMMYLEPSSSGVCLFGVNNFCDELPGLMSKSWLNHYRIEGMFGRETLQHEIKGKVTLRTDYDHITKYQLAKMLSRIQSQYRRTAFESANVDMQSQKAFELARKGIPRAQIPGVPIIYSIDMVSFNLPYFALHIQTGGESDRFLRCFTHELGVSLGSTACCVRLQRRSIGPFFSDAALLDKQLTLQNILRNMTVCRNLLEKTASDPDRCHEVPAPRRNTRGLVDGPGLEPQEEDDAMRPAWPSNLKLASYPESVFARLVPMPEFVRVLEPIPSPSGTRMGAHVEKYASHLYCDGAGPAKPA